MIVEIKSIGDVKSALDFISQEVEKKSGANTDAIAKANAALDAFEATVTATKEANIALEAKMEAFEKLMSKPQGGNQVEDAKALKIQHLKSLQKYAASDVISEELKALRTDIEGAGGVLVHDVVSNEMIKFITENSAVRGIANVTTLTGKRLKKLVRKTLPTIYRNGETEAMTESQGSYGAEFVDAYKYTALVKISQEELDDADFNMEAEALGDVAEALTQAEGYDFVQGNGIGRATGYMTSTALKAAARVTGQSAILTMDSIIQLTGDLKTGYNPQYVFNRKTLAAIRILKTTTGEYLWNAGNLVAGVPNQLNGENYTIIPDMDDVAANAYPIAFGDFRKAYQIVDRKELSVVRDQYTSKHKNLIELAFTKRSGGKLVNEEALKYLKVST